jgi:NAD(P)-dependent dehydrogenase (short-subunit alcohol dehydrogenase family)
MKLKGKVALVTGGNSGIGLAAAKLLAAHGAFVYICGRRPAELQQAVKAIGCGVSAIPADVSNLADLDRVYRVIADDGRRLDILLANAGSGTYASLESITEEHYDGIFDTNVKGVLFTVQKALAHFNDGGSIILTASIASIKGIPALSVYNATKAAVRSFARSWILDLRDRRIRVNVLSPGAIDTPGLRKSAGDDPSAQAELVASFAAQVPAGRIGESEDVANAALFLASADSAYINGIELFVDGGFAQF